MVEVDVRIPKAMEGVGVGWSVGNERAWYKQFMTYEEMTRLQIGIPHTFRIELPNANIDFTVEAVQYENDGIVVQEKCEYYGSSGHVGGSQRDSRLVFYPFIP